MRLGGSPGADLELAGWREGREGNVVSDLLEPTMLLPH